MFMQQITVNDREIALNKKGFLVAFNEWDRDVAMALAEQDELELSDCHWIAINFVREFYGEFEVPPSPRILIKSVGDKISDFGCDKKTLESIFPKGGCKHVCRLAGLPESYCNAC
jgi:tRNA 2-thiouridine synthesizing protein E